MSEEPKKPQNPWSLNRGRIVLLALGVLLLLYFASAVFGGLGNYQQLKEASQAAKAQKVDIAP